IHSVFNVAKSRLLFPVNLYPAPSNGTVWIRSRLGLGFLFQLEVRSNSLSCSFCQPVLKRRLFKQVRFFLVCKEKILNENGRNVITCTQHAQVGCLFSSVRNPMRLQELHNGCVHSVLQALIVSLPRRIPESFKS